MKNTIEWHKECLKNSNNSLDVLNAQIKNITEDALRLANNIREYTLQIQRAEREGRKDFDRDKYNVKRIGSHEKS